MSKNKIEVSMNVYDIPIVIEELEKAEKEIKQLQHENQQLKKQKDDVVDWLNNNYCYVGKKMTLKPYSDLNDLLRMLGERDVED